MLVLMKYINYLFLGREGAFRDVIIDTVGGITLILINLFRMHIVVKFNEDK